MCVYLFGEREEEEERENCYQAVRISKTERKTQADQKEAEAADSGFKED